MNAVKSSIFLGFELVKEIEMCFRDVPRIVYIAQAVKGRIVKCDKCESTRRNQRRTAKCRSCTVFVVA